MNSLLLLGVTRPVKINMRLSIQTVLYGPVLKWQFAIVIACWSAMAQAKTSHSLSEHINVDSTLLIILLLLLTGWLAYSLTKSRLKILNISAIDFHALADNAHDGIFIIQNGQLVYANQRAADILSYANEELLGLNLKTIVHPDEAEQVFNIHQQRIRGEDVPSQYEATFVNKHDGKVPVELTAAVTIWHGNPAGLVIIRDITDRKLIQQTLIDSEKRYRSLVENSPDAIVIIDTESNKIIEANEQACQLFKLTEQQLFEKNTAQLSNTGPAAHNQKPLLHYLERALYGLPLIFEYAFRDNENRIFSCEVRLSRMPFPTRRLVRASITDITERKTYQSALKKSELRLSHFFEASFETLFFHDKGIVLDVNNTIEKMFGYNREDVIGHHVLEYVAPESQALAQTNMSQGIDGPYELMAKRKDGSLFPIQVQAKTLHHDNQAQRIVSVTDISNLQQANEKLIYSELNLKSIIDNIPDTFYRTGPDGKLLMVSPSVEDLLGYTADELIGTDLSTLYADPYDRQFFLDALNANNGELRAYESALRHKNGDILWVSTNARYRYDKHGHIEGVEGISRDITVQRNVKDELGKTNAGLEKRVAERTRQLSDKIAELEKLQSSLVESEQNFHILVDNAVDIFLLHDAQGNIIDVNRQACKSLGYRKQELLQLNIEDIDIGSVPVNFNDIVKTLSDQPSLQIEGLHRRKDGSTFPVEVNLGLLKKTNTKLILALARDISKRSPVRKTVPTHKTDKHKTTELS